MPIFAVQILPKIKKKRKKKTITESNIIPINSCFPYDILGRDISDRFRKKQGGVVTGED